MGGKVAFEHDVLCAICRENLQGAESVAEHPVYKLGELSYIELAHVACAQAEDLDKPMFAWTWDYD